MVLVFDPGPSTGVAVLTMKGDPVFTTVLLSVREVKDYCNMVSDRHIAHHVVIEEGPDGGQYRKHTQQIEETLREEFPDAVWVKPGQWKGHPSANAKGIPRTRTQHEKDAVSLGRWFIKVRLA